MTRIAHILTWSALWFGAGVLIAGTTNLTLAWTAYGESAIGFNLYRGSESRQYTSCQFIPGAQTTNATVTVPEDEPSFFALTATNAGGLESDFSREAVFGWMFPLPQFTGTNSVLLTVEETSNPTNHWHKLTAATNAVGLYRLRIEGPFIQP